MELNFKNITITIPDTLNDVTFGKWLDYSKELEGFEKLDPASFDAQLRLYRMAEIMADLPEGGLDDLMIDETTILIKEMTEVVNKSGKFIPNDIFTIDGITYKARKIKDLNDLTSGEYISLKTIQTQYEKDPHLFFPLMVAILVRPATEVEDAETGQKSWKIEPFQSRDIENLHWRAELFRDKARAKDLMPVITFFLNGKQASTNNIETSSGQEQKLMKEETPSQQP